MKRDEGVPALTRRERDVLGVLCRQRVAGDVFGEPASVREIARVLYVSEAAVKQHLLRLYDKFGIWEGEEDAGPRRLRLANEALRRGALGPQGSPPPEVLVAARRALAAREWSEAFHLFHRADAAGPLSAADLEGLGEAAMWSLHVGESISARTRAHGAYLEEGDNRGAARTAIGLAANHFARLRLAVAAGWLAKAAGLVDGEDCAEAGVARALTALIQALTGETDQALENACTAQQIGRRVGNPDSVALGLVVEGLVLVRSGRLREGNARLDQAMASAAAGELGPTATGIVYCRTISTCLEVFDFTRAQEWTEEIGRLERTTNAVGFPGDCRTHRAALHLVGGRWREGEQEAVLVCTEEGALEVSHSIDAYTTIGEVRLRRGDLEGAEAAFVRARELGGAPEPGWSLLQLARGDREAGATAIGVALSGASDRLVRARLLPAKVRIALANDDVDGAAAAARELAEVAGEVGTAALRAAAAHAQGCVELARTNAVQAAALMRVALAGWREVDAPYEGAQARVLLGEALRALGDEKGAAGEFGLAAATFDQIGAAPDAASAHRSRINR